MATNPQQVTLVDASGNPISSSNPNQVNIAQFGGVATQMATSDFIGAGNFPEFVPGLIRANGQVGRWFSVGGQTDGILENTASVGPFLFNGTSWDRQRANQDSITVQTLTAQGTGTVNSTIQTNYNWRGLVVVVNITAITAGSLTVHIQGNEPTNAFSFDLLVSAALAAVAKTALFVYPGIAATANVSANVMLPRSWLISSVVATGPVTATITASMVV